MERFYETLFEVSNDYRHSILLLLKEKPMRITEISKELKLTTQEISRHASRLGESELIYKDVDGLYHLTHYGELIHILLEELQFVSRHRDYFVDHSVTDLSPEFVKRLGDLSDSRCINNTLEFLHYIDKIIRESKESVWLQVDQYPLTSLGSIVEGLKKGVKFRVIEQSEMLSGPHMNLESLEEAQTIVKTRNTSLSEQRTLNEGGVFMFLSEDKCAVAFPTKGTKFDYQGFTSSDERSVRWCKDLFQYYWERADPTHKPYSMFKELEPLTVLKKLEQGAVVVEGRNSLHDAKAVQGAVDQYDDVLLRGTFNFGTSTVRIGRSVRIRGEKNNGQLTTRIYKRGWAFPFVNFDSVFEVNGDDVDVIIESIHFTDFNCTCINGRRGRSLKIINNMMTLETGYGRGWKYHQYGDVVSGIWLDSLPEPHNREKNFTGGVVIEGNYLDFAQVLSEASAYYLSPELSDDIPYQPKLAAHEYYIGIGINILNLSGKVEVRVNIIRNMNARGISVIDIFSESGTHISKNLIESRVPGSYPFNESEAGVGIFAQSSFQHKRPGIALDIDDNTIQLVKPDYCGIMALESAMDGKKPGARSMGRITNNKINLEDGQASMKIGSKNFEVLNNTLSGETFFGIMPIVSGIPGTLGIAEANELTKNNDVSKLKLKDPRWWVSRQRQSNR